MLNILHVTESFGGGVKSAIEDYARNSSHNSHDLLFAARSDSPIGSYASPYFQRLEELPEGHLQRIAHIRKEVHFRKPDIVHAHSSLAGLYVRLAVRTSARTRIVYTPHCYAFERKDISALLRFIFKRAEHTLAFNTAHIAACSPRELMLSRWQGSRVRASLLPNVCGIESAALALGTLKRDDLPLSIVGAGRDGPQKDPDFFLDSVRALLAAGIEVDAVWIGGSDALRTRARGLPVRVTGWLSRDQALKMMASADIYLHSASWEGFPVAVLEAAMLRVPTVVRNIESFENLGLPDRITTPEEIIHRVRDLQTDGARQRNLHALGMLLTQFNDDTQKASLNLVYGR